MKTSIRATVLLLAGCSLAAAATAANAQTTKSPGSEGSASNALSAVGEIVVTAAKREQALSKVGMSVQAITGANLAEQQITSLSDIAKVVPGLSFTQTGNSTPVYTLRGVGFYDFSLASYPTVSTYLDQTPLPFPVLTFETAFDLERIEVLKGPQGTLFGQNSTGGAINYIAAKPTQSFSAGGQLSYGRFNSVTGDAYVSGPLSSTLTARLAVHTAANDDWQTNYTRKAGNGSGQQYAGRLLLDWKPTDTLKFELNVNGWRDRSDPQAIQYIYFAPNLPTYSQAVADYPTSPHTPRDADWSPDNPMRLHRDFWQAALRADWEFAPEITLTSITSFLRFYESGAQDQDGIALQNLDTDPFNGNIHSFSQELRVANGSSGRLRWIVGGNYGRDRAYYDQRLVYVLGSGAIPYGITTSENYALQRMENIAGFANADFDIMPKLTLKAGIRYTESRRNADICNHDGGDGITAALFTSFKEAFKGGPVTPLGIDDCFAFDSNFDTGLYHGTLNQHNVSWRTGVDYKPSSTLLLFANVAKGYKAGGYPNVNASSQSQYAPVTQESILEYEAGFKAQLLDKTVSINGTAFYMDYKNKQLRSKFIDIIFGALDGLVNVPKSHIAGGELEVNLRPFRGLTVSGIGTYLDTRIDRFVGVNGAGQVADFKGTLIPYTPKWQLGSNVRYEWHFNDKLTGYAAGQVTYRSGTTAIIGDDPRYTIKAYTLVDLQLGVEGPDRRWNAGIWGKNVFNKYYWTNVLSNNDVIGRYTGMPATYGVTFGIRY